MKSEKEEEGYAIMELPGALAWLYLCPSYF